MKSIFWTGKLTLPVLFITNSNNILAWITGKTRDEGEMKKRVKAGYDGEFSDHVSQYDELASYYQIKAAVAQLDEIEFNGKEIIDIGCGTGIIAFLAYDKGAKKIVCGDISEHMLDKARQTALKKEYDLSRFHFCQLDAESLPFEDNSFDLVITGMSFGLFPNQKKATEEMFRVLRPGGFVSLGAHGPEHYWEAIDATIRSLYKKYVLGYRFEFWPKTEAKIRKLMEGTGFIDITTNRFIWRNLFRSTSDSCDFFAAVTSNWWYAKIPEVKRNEQYEKTKKTFKIRGTMVITDDIVVGYGRKPISAE